MQSEDTIRSELTEWWTLHGHWVHHWHWSHLGHHLGNHLGNNLGFCKGNVVFLLTCFRLAILLMNFLSLPSLKHGQKNNYEIASWWKVEQCMYQNVRWIYD